MIRNLDVFLWNRRVGSLVAYKERYTEKICFYFDRDFLDSGYDIAPLRVIADSLPDHWGNKVFNEWAKIHRINTRELSALDRLAYINLNPETGECYSGQVAAPTPGYVPMIVKFDEHSEHDLMQQELRHRTRRLARPGKAIQHQGSRCPH